MARGGPSPNPAALPKVEFVKVQDEVSAGGPPGVQDGQARSFGCTPATLSLQNEDSQALKDNDGYPYTRPELYIRHIEPLEIDLARQVEYDMDEQDEEWLEVINAERKKEHLDRISAETFEIIMDRLEKEWFDLTKNLPKSDLAMPSEDSTCAVCDDSEGENSNAIVFCDGCNLAVHQDCYGVPYIPEGQWLCRKCTVSPENPVQCYLCPNEGGAFKQTIHGEWVHLLCAIWVPETRVANDVFMEPITGIEKISKQRWKLRCSVCDVREGACIQCAKSSCFIAFHATCARQEKLLLPMKTTQGAEPAVLQAFCERHLPDEQQNIRATALAAEEEQGDNKHSSKAARAYNKTYKPGPPIVPAIIVNRITHYIHRIKIRKKIELVQLICRYWSLKREARRGAPLLKRLHLEPWTASGGKIQTIEEKRMKLEQLQALRRDLTYVKMLTLLVKFREMRKLRQTEITHRVLSLALYPHEAALRMALETIMAADKQDYFKNPVNKNEVPDYFDIVLNPMCWSMIEDRLDKHEYWDVRTFKDDIDLVINNAILYNQHGTPFYKVALRIRSVSQPALKKLEGLALPAEAMHQHTEGEGEPNLFHPLIGDLESPLELLEILLSSDAVKDGLNLELGGSSPIASLLNTELAQYKPPVIAPPSPELTPKVPTKKSKKRDRRAEAERTKVKKAAALASKSQTPGESQVEEGAQQLQDQTMLEAADGGGGMAIDLREPRTRASVAAAVAFEIEAHGGVLPEDEVKPRPPLPPAEVEPQAGPSKPRKRPSMTLPPLSIPRVVDDVDNQGSFQLFNSGWILPAESKRHGRTPVEKASLPPPKKRQKTDHQSSRRASAASEAKTMSSPVEDLHTAASTSAAIAGEDHSKMEVDPFTTPVSAGFEFPDGGVRRMSVDTSGRVVIEELDTPYTRRQKSIKRKAEKQKVAEPGAEQAGNPAADETPIEVIPPSIPSTTPTSEATGPSTGPRRGPRKVSIEVPEDAAESESELSELSDLPSEAAAGPEAGPSSSKMQPNRKPTEARRKKSKRVSQNYESGTLVWAKADSYPWWPAVVFDADHPDIPANVLANFNVFRKRRKVKLYIVRFYDHNNSWQFLPRDKLKDLGEDKALDADMIAHPSIIQKWKSRTAREQCRAAYRIACAEIEPTDTPGAPSGEAQDQVDVVND